MLQSIALKAEYSYGNTQISVAPTSEAALSLNNARRLIEDQHLAGNGKDVDGNHVTVRYGLLSDDLDDLRSYLASLEPFTAHLEGIELFPASEHSEGAVPVVARVSSPELLAIEQEIGRHADFKEKNFPVYKPHATLAYCKPEIAERYRDLPVQGSFLVQSITISHQSGVQETIPFGMTQKWDESKHPRDKEGQFTTTGERAISPQRNADGFFGNPPEGYIRIYRGINPERNRIASEDDTHGLWYVTTYDEAVSYANWDYEGADGLGPNRAIRAVDVPLEDAFEFAKSGSRRRIDSAEELLNEERPVEMLVDDDVARASVVYEGDEEEARRGGRKSIAAKRQGRLWDESKHPRNPAGSSRGGEFTETLYGPKDALDSLLNKEKNVSIQRGDVHRFLELAAEQDEDPDLTDLQVEGMQIFGGNGLGIERKDMPQVPRDHRQQFIQYAQEAGVKVEADYVDPLLLKPTQNQISARDVALKLRKYEKGGREFPPILIAQNNRVLDGHHHWGMMAAFALEVPNVTVPVTRFKATTKAMLELMHRYDRLHGIRRVAIGKWDESLHPRDKEGQFAAKSAVKNLVYHAGHSDRDIAGPEDRPTYFADAPRTADFGKVVTPAHINIKNPYLPGTNDDEEVLSLLTEEDAKEILGSGYPPDFYGEQTYHAALQASLREDGAAHWQHQVYLAAVKKSGFDGVISTDTHGGSREYVVFYPRKQIRVAVKKADPQGRYVTPFVSFDRQGDDLLRLTASLNSSRLATWGFTAEAEVRGIARYRTTAVLDGRTSEFCREIDGKIFEVVDARKKVLEVLNVQNPEDLRTVQPWPRQTKAAMKSYRQMSAEELTSAGLHIPPYHPYCRTLLKPVTSSGEAVEEDDITDTIPDDVETFQGVTAEDLAELGVEATPEQVDQWNAYVGMSPVELMSRLSGVEPQELMTSGVGSKPIQFDGQGNFAFKAAGEVSGVEFKLGALLDPFTGTYYLNYADLVTGTPAAEVKYLRRMFNELIDIGKASPAAKSLAVGVAGNAAYYAKLGFLPDDLEWDSIRTTALKSLDDTLKPLMDTLAPEDQLLVRHLLQDQSVGALSALVDLPFSLGGKTLGEWVLGDIGGTWVLDLLDDAVTAQAKAYLS